MLKAHLAKAERHVAEGRHLIGKQRELVADFERDGHDTTEARKLLATLEEIEEMHIRERERISRELKELS